MNWQPIETAPKDGEYILVYAGRVTVAWFSDGEWLDGMNHDGYEHETHSPTHWMPLPPPPEAA